MNKLMETGHRSPRARDRVMIDTMEGIRKTLAYLVAKSVERLDEVSEDLMRRKIEVWDEVMSGEVWRDAVKVSAEILIGVKRYRECLERQESWRVVNQVRGRLEVFELVEKIMNGR